MKDFLFKADIAKQRLTEILVNGEDVRHLSHFFDEKNQEHVLITWRNGVEEEVVGNTAKNLWIAVADTMTAGRR